MSLAFSRKVSPKPFLTVQSLLDTNDAPTLPALSYVLRHPELWPAGFKWNYDFCTSCAIGLTFRLWPDSVGLVGGSDLHAVMRLMNMSKHDANTLFSELKERFPRLSHRREITPLHVANAIDSYVASKKRH